MEYEDETNGSAPLGERIRGAKKPGQDAGVDGVTDQVMGAGANQWPCLIVTELLHLLARCWRAQTAERRLATVLAAPTQKDVRPDGQSRRGA